MSFLAGRLAATEGAYFLQESKHAVERIIQKKKKNQNLPPSSPSSQAEDEAQADVLHDILRHSLPSKILAPLSDSSLAITSKWVLPHDPTKVYSLSADALNPLRAYVSLPQVTFGPKRWRLPEGESSIAASTANALRHDKCTLNAHSDKLKAAEEIGNSFVIATATVFGGATLFVGLMLTKLDAHNKNDIRTKGKDFIDPKLETIREKLIPLQIWVKNMSKKCHYKRADVEENSLVMKLSKKLSSK